MKMKITIWLAVALVITIGLLALSLMSRGPDSKTGRNIGAGVADFGKAIVGESAVTDPTSLHWAEDRAHHKSCTPQGVSIYHVRCEDNDGNWSTRCADFPQTNKFRNATLESSPIRAPLPNRDLAWTEVAIKDTTCAPHWNEQAAHDKNWCKSGGRVYHARCELPDTSPSTACSSLPAGSFAGRVIIGSPERLPANDWVEVVLQDDRCSISWRDDRAHFKSCSGGVAVYHVRCERQNGDWSHDCRDMERSIFQGKEMVKDPVRAPEPNRDPAWTEVQAKQNC